MSTIIVNATAARSSGALSILKQFVENIPTGCATTYYIFVDPSLSLPESENIKFIYKDTRNWVKRIFWDAFGFKDWVKKNKIIPSLNLIYILTCTLFHKVRKKSIFLERIPAYG